jgi:membrane protease YdiL (CAAX protease family)
VVLTPLPLIIIANAAVGRPWAYLATALLAGISAGIAFLVGVLEAAGAVSVFVLPKGDSQIPLGVGLMASAVVAATVASKPVRERLSRHLPLDPENPVHALALVLAVLIFGTQTSAILFTSPASSSPGALSVGDLLAQDAGLLVLAAAGVGLFMRRGVTQATARLGLVKPTWWQVVVALATAGVMFAFSIAMIELSRLWTPDLFREVSANTSQLFGGLVSLPVGIVLLALAPGISEEILFRGALQPRIGLIATALLFTASHAQYGLSLILVSVFASAIGLGLLRKFTNTTTSAISHAAYNLLVGIGIADSQVDVAVALELVLIAISAYAIWAQRRGAVGPSDSLTARVAEPKTIE